MSEAATKIFNDFRTKVGEKINLLDNKIENALTLGEDIADLQNSLSDLNEYLHSSFLEGILDPIKIEGISNYINNLQVEKSSIDSKFQVVYNSSYLTDIVKQGLLASKENFDSKHTTLVTAIEDAISDGKGTEEELDQIQALFLEYRSAIGSYTLSIENALEAITANRIDSITVGTRNILLNSKTAQLNQDGNIFRFIFSAVIIRWDNETIRWDNTTVRWDDGTPNVSSELLEGDHIVSVDVTSDVSQAITLKLSDDQEPTTVSERIWELEAGRKTRVYVHVKAKWNNRVLAFEIEKHVSNSNLQISSLKLAEGNKSDSYSPAPEDVEQAIEETRKNVTEAYQAYADAEAERKALESRVWADGKLTALEKKLLADSTAKANAARKFAEAQDLHLQILTEAYADGKISALEAELIDISEGNLEAAQAYVDAQIALEAIRSDQYADEEIAIERQRAIDDANQKYSDAIAEAATLAGDAQDAAFNDAQNKYDAAITHANAQALLAEQNAIADADGKITAEEQARITALEQYEQAAEAYADAARELAELNAAAYADDEIDAEEARAIADATQKMNDAKDHATGLADDLGIRVDDAFEAIDTERQRAIDDAQQKYTDAVAEAATLAGAAQTTAIADAQTKYEAAVTHANAQALLAEQNAIAHADGKITAEENARIQALIEYEAAAESYADAARELAEINANAHTDGEITDLEQRAIDDATQKMNEAKDLMNSLAEDLQSDVDGNNAYLLQLAEDNLQAAKDHTNAQNALLETAVKAYADGIVTDSEARSLQAAIEEADRAERYAKAQDDLLDIAIKSHMDGEITASEARAIHEAELKVQALRSEMETLQTDLEAEIDGVTGRLSTLETTTLEALEDGILNETEIQNLRVEKRLLDKEKDDVDRRYLMIIGNVHLEGDAKTELETAEFAYQASYTNLSSYYEDIFSTGEIPPGDPSALINDYSDSLAEFAAKMDAALESISQVKSEIAEGNAMDYADGRLDDEIIPAINDAQGAADALEYLTEETFWDGVFDQSEIQAYLTHIEPLNTEHEDIYSKYAVIYHNEFLKGSDKDSLYNAYDAYDNAHAGLITAILTIEEGDVTEGMKTDIRNGFTDYRAAINALRTAFEQASASIEVGRIDNIIVGTRNLLLDADNIQFQNESSSSIIYQVNGTAIRWDNETVRWDDTTVRWDGGVPNASSEDLSGQHAFGVRVRVPSQRVVSAELRDGTKTVKSETLVPAGKWVRIGIAINATEGTTELVLGISSDNISQLEYEEVKLEIGNKWTDYNPAPEDVRNEIETARSNALAAAESYAKAEAERQALEVKAHADGQISKMERKLLNHADAVANAARRYSEAEDTHLQILLESYADGEIDTLEAALIDLSNDNLAAAERAATAAKDAAILAANSYADGEISAMESTLQGYADSAASAAQAAAIAADAELKGTMEAYTDGEVDAEEAARIAALAAATDAANDYADAAEAAAILAASNAADGKITAMEATLQGYADNAAGAAQAAAIAADTALQGVLEAYADGKVEDEEQARIDALAAYAAAAETYADAAEEAAKIAAAAYADGEISDAEARAMADATQKMNEAKAEAQGLFDDLQDEVDAVSANAQQARDIADELAENLDSFGTKIGEHSIITGAVEVGSPDGGANAGISGVTDRGTDSVRFWGGAPHLNRYKARWRSFDSGTNEFGGVGTDAFIRIGIDEFGEPIIEFIRDDGGKAWSLGLNGIHFTNFQPERFRLSELLYLGNSSSDSSLLSNFNAALARNHPPLAAPLPPDEGGGTQDVWNCFVELDTDRYRYFAGNNFTSDTNRHLEAYHFARQNKDIEDPVNLVNDGWYMTRFSFQVPEDYRGFDPYEFSCFRILNGQDVEGGFKTVQFYPSISNIPIVY